MGLKGPQEGRKRQDKTYFSVLLTCLTCLSILVPMLLVRVSDVHCFNKSYQCWVGAAAMP